MPLEGIVIYDDDCGFCRWALALLLSVDRKAAPGALRPLPLGTAKADCLLHDLTLEEREASWHLVIDSPGSERLSFDATPARFSAGAAFAPALRMLPRGRRLAFVVARMPHATERCYRWIADRRREFGRFIPGRARRWADRMIAAQSGRPRP